MNVADHPPRHEPGSPPARERSTLDSRGTADDDLADEPRHRRPGEPERVGRYLVLGTLGSGGMGTVLEAFDRTLDRRVAVKILHHELGQRHTRRLLREAQAMASSRTPMSSRSTRSARSTDSSSSPWSWCAARRSRSGSPRRRGPVVLKEELLGPRHFDVAIGLGNLGLLLLELGRVEQGEARQAMLDRSHERLARALANMEEITGPRAPQVAAPARNLGHVLLERGELAEARASYQRALDITVEAVGHEHPDVANVLEPLAEVALAQHDEVGARVYAERAISIREAGEPTPVALARVRFLLARALWAEPEQRVNARTLAEHARDVLREAKATDPAELASLEIHDVDVDAATPGLRGGHAVARAVGGLCEHLLVEVGLPFLDADPGGSVGDAAPRAP